MKGPKNIVFAGMLFLAALFLIFDSSISHASDIYIAQNPSGANSGRDCADAYSAAWLNSSANWGSNTGQIGPGTTVHLCGTFTGAAGATLLTFRGSGSSGNPITLLFEANALLQAPYWSASGAIATSGQTWITIDGGSNGTIQNTQNGTPGASCLGGCAFQQDSRFIYISGCGTCNVEVKNLKIVNPYVHTGGSSDAKGGGGEGIFFSGNHSNITVDHVLCHDAFSCIDGWGNNISEYNNELYNCSSCIISGTNVPTTGLTIHDNYIHDYGAWNTPTNSFHLEGVHLFPNSGSGNMSGVLFYNNLFSGPGSGNNTAHIYFEGTFTSPEIFNNACINTSTQDDRCLYLEDDGGAGASITNPLVANNTVIGGCYNCSSANYAFVAVTGITFKNNISVGGNSLISLDGASSFAGGGVNNNVYENTAAHGAQGFGYHGSNYSTLAAWQSATGQDADAKFGTAAQVNLSSAAIPQSGSLAIGAGANLSSMGLNALNYYAPQTVGVTSSASASQRPASAAWTAGLYAAAGSAQAQPDPPSALTAVVH